VFRASLLCLISPSDARDDSPILGKKAMRCLIVATTKVAKGHDFV